MGPTRGDATVVAEGLQKNFGETRALDGVDLKVPSGTVQGLLGPNGAGKSTVTRLLATLTKPDAGHATVAGYDVVKQSNEVRSRIGLAGQHAALDDDLTGRENLRIFGKLFRLGKRDARRRADELLERFELEHAADRLVKTYSGGMRRRLDLISSLVISPSVLFLDEPTTGLDPHSRNEIWDTVRTLVGDGTTVLLTTQYLDEADQLADNIAVIDTGKVIASGTPDALKARIGARIDVVTQPETSLDAAAKALMRIAGSHIEPDIDADNRALSAPVLADALTLPSAVRQLDEAGIHTEDVGIRKPTLDEVFLNLTGDRRTHKEAAAR